MKQSLLLLLVLSSLYLVQNYDCYDDQAQGSQQACFKGEPTEKTGYCCFTSWTDRTGTEKTGCSEYNVESLAKLGEDNDDWERGTGDSNIRTYCGLNSCGEGLQNKIKSSCFEGEAVGVQDGKCCYTHWKDKNGKEANFCSVWEKKDYSNLEEHNENQNYFGYFQEYNVDCNLGSGSGNGTKSDNESGSSYVRVFFLGLFLFLF